MLNVLIKSEVIGCYVSISNRFPSCCHITMDTLKQVGSRCLRILLLKIILAQFLCLFFVTHFWYMQFDIESI